MNFFCIALIFLTFSLSAQAGILCGEDDAASMANKAYFIGVVSTSAQYESVTNENYEKAEVAPLFVYKHHPDLDIRQPFYIYRRSDLRTSWDVNLNFGIDEVLVVKEDGKLKIKRLAHINCFGVLDDLREQIRYIRK